MEERNKLIGKLHKIMELRSQGYVFDFDFPSIAVIGSQSSGKSSVVENIVGKQLLPRGTNMVTRCPIVLNLCHETTSGNDYAIFARSKFDENPQRIDDFNRVKEIIVERTEHIEGRYCVSAEPIVLNIYSKDYPDNLQLVDLPGFVRNPVADQPSDIKEQIEKLVNTFIAKDNAIILAVSDAMVDIAESAGISEARNVDEKGLRTVGVLTKLDILQKEKIVDVLNTLNNKLLPLSKGYVGIVNMPIEDGENSLSAVRAKEMAWYRDSAFHKKLVNFGTGYLQSILGKELSQKIREKIPEIIASVNEDMENAQLELDEMGYSEKVMNQSVSRRIIDKVKQYESDVIIMLQGNDRRVSHESIQGGALLKQLLKKEMTVARDAAMKLNPSQFGREIEIMLQNLDAAHDTILPNSIAFRKCVGILVEKFKKPFFNMINKFTEELNNHLQKCADNSLAFAPNLKIVITETVREKVFELRELCKADMNRFVDIQKVFVNTGHPNFKLYHNLINGIKTEDGSSSEPVLNEEEEFHDAQSGAGDSNKGSPFVFKEDSIDKNIKWIKARATAFSRFQKEIGYDHTKLGVPISTQNRKDFFLDIVLAYMLILETSLCHTGLKLVMYHLVQSVVDFHESHALYVQLLEKDESKMEEYLEMDQFHSDKMKKCLQQKEGCQQLLKILRDAN